MELTTIPAMVRASAQRFAERVAVVDDSGNLTYAELGQAVDDVARAAAAAGVAPGDRVAIWAPNSLNWILAALGTLAAGGVLVPLNTRFKGREAGDILERSGATLLFTVRGFLDTDYPMLLKEAGVEPPPTIVINEPSWEDFLAGGEGRELPEVALTPNDLSDLMFTSGTTGRSKGVMTTHRQTLEVFEVWSRLVGLQEGDRYLVVNPFFHTFGYKAGIIAALMRGATVVPQAVFDAGQVLARIAAERITFLPGPPTLYQSIMNDPGYAGADTSSLRTAVTGAANVPVELIRRMRDTMGFDTVLHPRTD